MEIKYNESITILEKKPSQDSVGTKNPVPQLLKTLIDLSKKNENA